MLKIRLKRMGSRQDPVLPGRRLRQPQNAPERRRGEPREPTTPATEPATVRLDVAKAECVDQERRAPVGDGAKPPDKAKSASV